MHSLGGWAPTRPCTLHIGRYPSAGALHFTTFDVPVSQLSVFTKNRNGIFKNYNQTPPTRVPNNIHNNLTVYRLWTSQSKMWISPNKPTMIATRVFLTTQPSSDDSDVLYRPAAFMNTFHSGSIVWCWQRRIDLPSLQLYRCNVFFFTGKRHNRNSKNQQNATVRRIFIIFHPIFVWV